MAVIDFYLNENSTAIGDPVDVVSQAASADFDILNAGQVELLVASESKVHVAFEVNAGDAAALSNMNNREFFQIKDGSDNVLFALKVDTAGTLSVNDYCYSDGLPINTALTSVMSTTALRFDVEFQSSATGGVIQVYVDNVSEFNRTGDTQYVLADTPVVSAALLSATGDATVTRYANFFIADSVTPTRTMTMLYQPITGVGKYSDFTGAYTDLTNLAIDDATFMTGAQGGTQSFSLNDLPAEYSSHTIVAVGAYARCRSDATNTVSSKTLICSATTADEIIGSNGYTDGSSFGAVREIYDTAPDGLAWDHTKYSDLEIGIKNQ